MCFASCSLPACFLGRAARSVLLHSRNTPSPFLTLSDVLGFLLFVDHWLGLLPLFVSPKKKDCALSMSASNVEGGILPVGVSK